MKKITFIVCALVCGIQFVYAQRLVSDLKIYYKMELPAEQAQMDAMLNNSHLVQYVRGNMSRIDMNFNVVNYIYISNARTKTMLIMIDNHGDKYMIRTNKKEFEKELEEYRKIQFVDQPEEKEIAGYKCRKAIGIMSDGSKFEVFYTVDIAPENKLYNRRFVNLKGFPLEFEIPAKNNAKIKVLATSLEIGPVPASIFDTPSGYKEISQEELKKLRG
ncbi:hypothetical protein COR50_10020 [Chitinophaga caeni]|uniref:Uncharacterized protein n=1 Tax=Chitinophaga caeni TaxID=2029983 RepID=A0A291QUF1_9BACT|nr:DUF4412 domain-containing protein [Chitinophaga caeni]ATL47484.1 hypothetical protein COR50_10020 [Chitinophaga caeni]